MSQDVTDVSGGCYCGKVRYRAARVSAEISECHCSQCRKQSGHRYAVTSTRSGDVSIEGGESITWFRSSPQAERGFCSHCGSHLFWRSREDDEMAILAGSLDNADGFRQASHIFVESKGGYYDIADGLPQFKGYDTPVAPD